VDGAGADPVGGDGRASGPVRTLYLDPVPTLGRRGRSDVEKCDVVPVDLWVFAARLRDQRAIERVAVEEWE